MTELAVTPPGDDGEVLADLVPMRVEAVRVRASPERLADLEAKIARARRRSRAESTLRAYRSDCADFEAWCAGVGLVALPAEPATVAAYIAELADPAEGGTARRASTIERRLAALSEAHKVSGVVANPVADPLVRATMSGIRRMLSVAQDRKRGVSTEDIRAAATAMGERIIDIRDRAVLLVGYAGGFRRSDVVRPDVEDLEDHPGGLLIYLDRSKTDQEGAGRRVEIAYGQDPVTCPVRATRRWLEVAAITTGPWLRPVDRHGNIGPGRLSDRAVARAVQRRLVPLGYSIDELAGHSLRRGMATTAKRNGAPTRTVMATTGHTSEAGLDPYIEDAELFTDPASAYLGL